MPPEPSHGSIPGRHGCSAHSNGAYWAVLSLTLALAAVSAFADREQARDGGKVIKLRAWGVPDAFGIGPVAEADRQIQDEFRRKYPWVDPVSTTGLRLPGASRGMDMVPFMQIAGDIAPDVMYVNFRQSQTYIDMKLLYPLDRYVEKLVGVKIPDSGPMSTEAYLAELRKGSGWSEVKNRAPRQCWQVMRRRCPYDRECPHRKEWGLEPVDRHQHIWAFPVGALTTVLAYDKPLFAEYAEQGVEMRVPRDWEEMLRWAKIMTHPEKGHFGMSLNIDVPSWQFMTFLYSAGGNVVEKDDAGNWRCTLDTDEAVEAAWFYARLRLEKVRRGNREYRLPFHREWNYTLSSRH